MNIMSAIKTLTQSEIFRVKETLDGSTAPDLVRDIECARREWQLALKEIDYADRDLDGHVIFKINSTERRYMALLEQARKEGMCAWPELSQFPFADEIEAAPDSGKNEALCAE